MEDKKIIRENDLIYISYIISDEYGNILENSSNSSEAVSLIINTSDKGLIGLISKNLINKRVGDSVQIIILPEFNLTEPYDKNLVVKIENEKVYSIIEELSEKEFLEFTGLKEIKINRTFWQKDLQITVIDYDNETKTVKIQYVFLPDQAINSQLEIKLKNYYAVLNIPAIVKSVNETNAILKYDVKNGDIIKATILYDLNNPKVAINKIMDGIVINKTDNHFLVDFNDPLAGKSMILQVTTIKKEEPIK
ncbi:MAG: hypothetical protein QW076_03865 [Candidatus Anstonellales archaeon]